MGKLEQQSRKRSKRKHLQQIILATVAGAGILGIGLLAPNVLGAMAKLGIIPNRRQKEYVSSSASKMVKKGLMRFNGKFYELTMAGQERLRRWEFNQFKFERPKKWDKKWRVIIFDIPDKKRKERDQIRTLFKSAGFYLLQESVWVYPYDCEDIIALLKTDFGVGKNLLYLIVEELENDRYLRDEFDLV
ncbi:MAG: CRISPR-associated endonuclease Cas2 [Candidatus Zambryskibacteria bacterium RIFCSPHIGHO2_12_FULL_48_10]|uniref:CRISPR-associated endonuclease Cas2 n=1 Tax=Candidatus Zambryskibacteria bacterium RIFCSPHIGHO2_01_FULL_46_25 TaxID=1802738 RepID=A0A1G2SYP9_9BACT|nr:MAG: Transcriptional regulator, PaaX family [Parcubacteria group bacterium GW2011_GWA1_47_10]OHA90123.1 MAG: CRISPR-associated endonuclease Cas2 [Candidatus Zambryskibacteria bacterium RIFCSPHIGHO2_01_FULL_46_25]OHB01303.1 MAG: CRISPR-associated endonuclease Cas2 [Candidatus Zambryskibacteria bacterium RIFCSPHIGHO2_12_FULL_48_10]OHB06502.1 MAG: CRISPR-associated endonuclease Cas2 [Candidatus Zambryskibacteria bacterium RIFCSPLOWO2_01_FULL_48_25]